MPSSDLTPLYLTQSQLSQLLMAQPQQGSALSIPVNMTQMYAPMMAQQFDQSMFPQDGSGTAPQQAAPAAQAPAAPSAPAPQYIGTEAMQAAAKGGLIRNFAKGGIAGPPGMEDLLDNGLYNDEAHVRDAIASSPQLRKMVDVQEAPHVQAQASASTGNDDADIVAQYDTDKGRNYLDARRKLQQKANGGMVAPINLHDVVNGNITIHSGRKPDAYAAGGPVRATPILHNFRRHVAAVNPIPKQHYRDDMGDTGLAKVRTQMRVR